MKDFDKSVICGDCLDELGHIQDSSVDMVYLDPPFFTNRRHSSVTRDRLSEFSFSDIWNGLSDYAEFMEARLRQVHRILKSTGSVFVHCDSSANFMLRALLDTVFGKNQFRSEIIWTYRRWSNSSKGLLPAHQTILFFSKSDNYKFNQVYGAYSETTNVDQILQRRARDEKGVSVYARDEEGNILFGGEKKGVPLSDVWHIPFLNPKAKERTGYPTQKPILLLERIINISTDPGDLIVDPFCGSGTTLVAARLLGRSAIGIDISKDAVKLAWSRLREPIKTESDLMKKGRDAYDKADKIALALLDGLDVLPVHRNAGIDAFLNVTIGGSLVPIRVQRRTESIAEAADKLAKAAKSKKAKKAFLVQVGLDKLHIENALPELVEVIDSTAACITQRISDLVVKESQSSSDSSQVKAQSRVVSRAVANDGAKISRNSDAKRETEAPTLHIRGNAGHGSVS